MNNTIVSILALSLLTCAAQSQVAESHPLPAGTTIPAMLDKWVDARKSKVGDEITAQTTEHVKADGQIIIPKGSKIFGKVTEAKAQTNDDSSSVVGIVFDRAVLKKGGELPLQLIIQAIAPDVPSEASLPAMAPSTQTENPNGMGPMNHPSTMGANADPNAGTPGRPESPVNSAYDPSGGRTANGRLTPQCHGVLGIDGLILGLEPKTETSLIASKTKNVRLDGRTQLMLRVMEK